MSRSVWMSCAAFALAVGLFAAPAIARDFVDFPHNLTANQFASNCTAQGGSASIVSASSDGGKAINCNKHSGGNVTCAFDSAGAVCVGSTGGSGGGRPQ
jgi:putative hemolysin